MNTRREISKTSVLTASSSLQYASCTPARTWDLDWTDGVLARMAGAGSGECGWMRDDIVLEVAFGCELSVRECDDEEMKEQTEHNRRNARRGAQRAPARTSFAAYK